MRTDYPMTAWDTSSTAQRFGAISHGAIGNTLTSAPDEVVGIAPTDSLANALWTLSVHRTSDSDLMLQSPGSANFTPFHAFALQATAPSVVPAHAIPRIPLSPAFQPSPFQRFRMKMRRNSETIKRVENIVFLVWGVGLVTAVCSIFGR